MIVDTQYKVVALFLQPITSNICRRQPHGGVQWSQTTNSLDLTATWLDSAGVNIKFIKVYGHNEGHIAPWIGSEMTGCTAVMNSKI